ncbi:MAG: hypothetical protein BGN99_10100 [Alphaproteobacteria bacterium 65-37]|nr:MAG: hypothetical protein BGN99_10100 [Alphaproteobacteria bacterium 65-37]
MLTAQDRAASRTKPLPISAASLFQSKSSGLNRTASPARPRQIPASRGLVTGSPSSSQATGATHSGVV